MKCPICHTLMNEAPEQKKLLICPECMTHYKDGQVLTVDRNGNLKPVAKSTGRTIAFYFESQVKRQFDGIAEVGNRADGWVVLTKADGKEIIVNSSKVNFIEEV